jgi:hypothetical protein
VARRPIVDGFYGWLLDDVDCFERRRAPRSGPLRGLLLFCASVRAPAVVVIRTDPGWRTLLLLRALFGRRRKLVVLQFIVHPGTGRAWDAVDRWAVRRALRTGQVLSEWESAECARRYGIERFVWVPWAWRRHAAEALDSPARQWRVLCAGRAFCDWETLFDAARGRDWPLAVVCSREDETRVRRLGADCAEVHSEVPPERFRELLGEASIVVVAMRDAGVSQGHVRLMDANDAGVAVVCSATRSVESYVADDETAALVPPGDAPALRAAVERLLADPEERERLRRAAFERSQRWTGEMYLAAIGALIRGESPRTPAPSITS